MTAAAPNPDFEIRLAKTEASLSELGQNVKDLVGAMRGFADKMDTRGRTNWGLIVSIIGAAMVGMAYYGSNLREPIVMRQEAQASEITALRQAVVPRAEVQSLVRQGERDNDLIRNRIERFEARVTKELDRLIGTVYVPAWSKRS